MINLREIEAEFKSVAYKKKVCMYKAELDLGHLAYL